MDASIHGLEQSMNPRFGFIHVSIYSRMHEAVYLENGTNGRTDGFMTICAFVSTFHAFVSIYFSDPYSVPQGQHQEGPIANH
jgi:hypothetical protein